MCGYSVDLARLIEETLVGCWWGRTAAKTTTEALPIGEIYPPQSPPVALLDKKGLIEPIIDIEPMLVCVCLPFVRHSFKHLQNWVVMLDKAGLRRILINLVSRVQHSDFITLTTSRSATA
jgi:hypothetical protein